jgi:hypothetical protein
LDPKPVFTIGEDMHVVAVFVCTEPEDWERLLDEAVQHLEIATAKIEVAKRMRS